MTLLLPKVLLDCGAVQADALTVDRLASLEKVLVLSVRYKYQSCLVYMQWLE